MDRGVVNYVVKFKNNGNPFKASALVSPSELRETLEPSDLERKRCEILS